MEINSNIARLSLGFISSAIASLLLLRSGKVLAAEEYILTRKNINIPQVSAIEHSIFIALEESLIQGVLDADSQVAEDGSYYNIHSFEGIAGEEIFIEVNAKDFNPQLILLDSENNYLVDKQNNDETKSVNAVFLVPDSKTYYIAVRAPVVGESGEYNLIWRDASEVEILTSQAEKLFQVGQKHYEAEEYQEALQSWEQSLAIYRQIDNKQQEAIVLMKLGDSYQALGELETAIEIYNQSLEIFQKLGDSQGKASSLIRLGEIYGFQRKYQKAIDVLQQGVEIARGLNNFIQEGGFLWLIAQNYIELNQYDLALEYDLLTLISARKLNRIGWEIITTIQIGTHSFDRSSKKLKYYQQALSFAREVGDRKWELATLHTLSLEYSLQKQYDRTLEHLKQALEISREFEEIEWKDSLLGQIWLLRFVGLTYVDLGDYSKAIASFQEALNITRKIENWVSEVEVLQLIGTTYQKQEEYQKSLETFQKMLDIIRERGGIEEIIKVLHLIGGAYHKLGQGSQELEVSQQALFLAREINHRELEGKSISSIAGVYLNRGQYLKAREYYQQVLAIARKINNSELEIDALNFIGTTYGNQRQYVQALEYARQALIVAREAEDREEESQILNGIGLFYSELEQHEESLRYYQQALAIAREINDRETIGLISNNLGRSYKELEQYDEALDFYQQGLIIAKEPDINPLLEIVLYMNILEIQSEQKQIEDEELLESYQNLLVSTRSINSPPAVEAFLLLGVGVSSKNLGQYDRALEYSAEGLTLARSIGDPLVEVAALSVIGDTFKSQNQSETAIVFYKQAVNKIEEIRQEIRVFPIEWQQSFTDKFADTVYRPLADLLIEQGRILEAQQVLELLKIQELREYLDDRQIGETLPGVVLLPAEEEILKTHTTLLAFTQELDRCEKNQCSELTQLRDRRDALATEYRTAIKTLETTLRDRLARGDILLDPHQLGITARKLVNAQPNTVLIYPLVLEDKIWLLWAKGNVFTRREIPIGRKELAATVVQFRQFLEDRHSDRQQLQELSQQLYNWLIAPIAAELPQEESSHLVFALDRETRYIPMAALFDGENYLIENHTITTILSAALTNTSDRLPANPENAPILALGLSEAVADFDPLPNVAEELDAIVREDNPSDRRGIYPGLQFLNRDFHFQNLRDKLAGRKILHIATHAEFIPGHRDRSYLLLGDGSKLPIPDIETISDYLDDIHLVVLSACETALGGTESDGIEIPGLGYYFLNGGAETVAASLWRVNDRSTSLLMEEFYRHLSRNSNKQPISKAEALRQAQLSLLFGQTEGHQGSDRSQVRLEYPPPNASSPSPSNFSHPYYWAPFILIGNGL